MPNKKIEQMTRQKLCHQLLPNSPYDMKVKAGCLRFMLSTTTETLCKMPRSP